MTTKYGTFADASASDYKTKLHKKMFWLLLYKDPKTADEYKHVDFDEYFTDLMKELKGLESMLVKDPGDLIGLMTMLQAAYNETLKDEFNYRIYRKFVLDAHSALDRLDFNDDYLE